MPASLVNFLSGPGPSWLVFAAYFVVPLVLMRYARRVAPRNRPLFAMLALLAVLYLLLRAFGLLAKNAANPSIVIAANLATLALAASMTLVALRYLPRSLANVEEQIQEEDIEQYQLLQAAVLACGDGILVTETAADGMELRIAFANPAFELMTGYSADEAIGHSPSILCMGQTEAEIDGHIAIRAAMRANTSVRFEIPSRRKDGAPLWAEWRVVPVCDRDGVTKHRIAVLRDTTERRQAEDALRERESFLRAVITHIPCGVFWKDRNLVYQGCNDLVVRDHGVASADQLVGKTDPELPGLTAAEAAFFQECDRKVIESGQAMLDIEELQTRPDGNVSTLLTSKVPLRNAVGEVVGVLGTYLDITARKRIDLQLRQAAKLEAVGRLTGGIAHDFNNILTVILGNAELLRMPTTPPVERAGLLADISVAADRGAGMVRQLLLFSRGKPARIEIVDLNAVVAGLDRMLGRWLGDRVVVKSCPSRDPVRVRADKSQLEQIVMNLAVNARDAMPEGGTLTISTSLDRDMRTGVWSARLTMSDTGTGMTPEVRARVFEPFFTTKEMGKGTGLGLATVRGIVEQAGGRIEVESAVGTGTTFRVVLPSVLSAVNNGPMRETDTPLPGSLGCSVMLVEDEDYVRKYARLTLEGNGYAVIEATDGENALGLLTAGESPDLMVTDLSMPRMNGDELAVRLRAMRPNLGVVFISGGPVDAAKLDRVPGAVYLPKPFAPVELLRALRQAMKRSLALAAVAVM